MKKILAASMALCLLLLCVLPAMAETVPAGIPSVTTQDMAQVITVTTSTGVDVATTNLVIAPTENTELEDGELTKIAEAAKTADIGVYFELEGSYSMNEFIPLTVLNYLEEYGDITVTFQFATVYAPEDVLTVMVGVYSEQDAAYTYTALPATADENGCVTVTFPKELLMSITNAGTSTVLAVLKAE